MSACVCVDCHGRHGYSYQQVYMLPAEQQYPTGAPIDLPDHILVQYAANATINLYAQRRLHPIPSEAVFLARGYQLDRVLQLPADHEVYVTSPCRGGAVDCVMNWYVEGVLVEMGFVMSVGVGWTEITDTKLIHRWTFRTAHYWPPRRLIACIGSRYLLPSLAI